MKTGQIFSFRAVLVIFGVAFMLAACAPPDEPKDRDELMSGLFGGNYTATVKGYLTHAQVNEVKKALNAGYDYTNSSFQSAIKTYFQENAVIIMVEASTEYTIYRTVSDIPVIYFNIAALGGALTAEKALKAMQDRLNDVPWDA
jgi:hypothetical protein